MAMMVMLPAVVEVQLQYQPSPLGPGIFTRAHPPRPPPAGPLAPLLQLTGPTTVGQGGGGGVG